MRLCVSCAQHQSVVPSLPRWPAPRWRAHSRPVPVATAVRAQRLLTYQTGPAAVVRGAAVAISMTRHDCAVIVATAAKGPKTCLLVGRSSCKTLDRRLERFGMALQRGHSPRCPVI